jgi:hypothetical protein
MGAVASFNGSAWMARYPEFRHVPLTLVESYFAEAGLYHSNDGSGPVRDAGQQLLLMGMVTAHIAALYARNEDGEAASPLVGRITNASEGSVSVQTQSDYPPGSAQWWQQSKYGASYWAATSGYRTMHYRPGRGRFLGSVPR